jgi:hypothetical protein
MKSDLSGFIRENEIEKIPKRMFWDFNFSKGSKVKYIKLLFYS